MNKSATSGLRNWDLVVVEWVDAWDAEAGWHNIDGYTETPCLVRTVGYWWANAKVDGYVVLVATRGVGQVSQVTHIPEGMIKSVTKLHPRSKPK